MTKAIRKGFAVETMLQAELQGSNSLKRLEAGKAWEGFERWRGKVGLLHFVCLFNNSF